MAPSENEFDTPALASQHLNCTGCESLILLVLLRADESVLGSFP